MLHLQKKKYSYNIEKNAKLLEGRQISFEQIIDAIINGHAIDIKKHPNQKKYPHQELIYVIIDEKLYVVPCIKENDDSIFLKTIFRCSRIEDTYLPGKKKSTNKS